MSVWDVIAVIVENVAWVGAAVGLAWCGLVLTRWLEGRRHRHRGRA